MRTLVLMLRRTRHLKTGLVLGGGGARGAYEAGVLSFLRGELEPGLGRRIPIEIVSGTSVGAINACVFAAWAEQPEQQARALVESWSALSLEDVLRVRGRDVLRLLFEVFGERVVRGSARPHGGLVDPVGLQSLVLGKIQWPSIGRALRRGALEAIAVSATHVASGRTYTFIQNASRSVPPWTRDPHFVSLACRVGPRHALGSAAIPLLFPPVRIGGSLFVDGGLRLNVPLAPAVRLGADRVIVISLRHPEQETRGVDNERAYATAPFLLGKTLNALMLDRTEQDLERLRRINALLEAGTRAYGRHFEAVLNGALVSHRDRPMRYVRNLLVRPSQDIGMLAAHYVRSSGFAKRATGLAGRIVRRMADREEQDSADLASYLLFDGQFASMLIELGASDARRLGDEWARFFADAPESSAEEAQWTGDDSHGIA